MSDIGVVRNELASSLVILVNRWKDASEAVTYDETLQIVGSEYVVPACKRCRDLIKALDALDQSIKGLTDLGIEVLP